MASLPAMPTHNDHRRPVVAIDGPAGAGKSTLAGALAHELRLPYINTGLMYRALASRAIRREVDPEDSDKLARLADGMRFALSESEIPELLIDGNEPDASLTDERVEAIVSTVAHHPEVRAILRDRQRDLGRDGSVMEGRDIGTVVCPDADVKIFLSADPEVRVDRRAAERDAERAESAVVERDARDRRTNPLEPAPDAFVLDSTRLGRDEVLVEALRLVREKLGDPR
jgi:cytidylate kinase